MARVLALDIGGTNTRAAIVDENKKIVGTIIKPTKVGNLNDFLENVASTIEDVQAKYGTFEIIAGGVPGRVRPDGYIYALPNVHIEQVPLASFLKERFGKECLIINDAEAAALAESNIGEHRLWPSLYFVTISTGVGGALTRNGKLVQSSYEVGHTMTDYRGELHEFEHLAAGPGIIKLALEHQLRLTSPAEFFTLVNNKNPLALEIYEEWLRLLCDFFSMIDETLTPYGFALTGGVMKSGSLFLPEIKRRLPSLKIERCSLDQEAGILGAGVLGLQHLKNLQ